MYPRVLRERKITNTSMSFCCICQLGSQNLGLVKISCNIFKSCREEKIVRPGYVMLLVWCNTLKTNFGRKNKPGHGGNG